MTQKNSTKAKIGF